MTQFEPDEHEYDGIKELDNPMPRWWVEVFWATIVVAAFYGVAFYFFGEFRIDTEYSTALAAHRHKEEFRERLAAINAAKSASPTQRVEAMTRDSAALLAGKAVFDLRCAMCHGDAGQGLVGPNLADHHWLHGDGKPESIVKVVAAGVDGKGMPPWKDILSSEQILQVTAFVRSLRGTSPPGGKAPEGSAYQP